LRSLQFDNTRYDKISDEHEGSFEWIWKHNEYKNWAVSDDSRVLFVQGKPGSGKSTLMKYFNRNLLFTEPAAQQAIVARFFYSFRDGESQRSHYSMLLSILYEILHQDEGFFYHFCQSEFRAHQRLGSQSKWRYGSLKRILKSLHYYRTRKRFYFVIDAVDESEEKDRREILGLFLELCSQMKYSVVKIFIASRPVAQLEARRNQFHDFIKLDVETRSDILNYVQSHLRGLNSTELLTLATAHVLENAQGVFIWVKLICQRLIEAHEEGYSEEEILRLLTGLPTELEDLYKLMLEKMEHNDVSRLHGSKMFQFILFAKRPLTVDEVLHALGILGTADSDLKFNPSDALFEKRIPSSDRIILSGGGNFLEIKKHNGMTGIYPYQMRLANQLQART
jgi:predicted kinase